MGLKPVTANVVAFLILLGLEGISEIVNQS